MLFWLWMPVSLPLPVFMRCWHQGGLYWTEDVATRFFQLIRPQTWESPWVLSSSRTPCPASQEVQVVLPLNHTHHLTAAGPATPWSALVWFLQKFPSWSPCSSPRSSTIWFSFQCNLFNLCHPSVKFCNAFQICNSLRWPFTAQGVAPGLPGLIF